MGNLEYWFDPKIPIEFIVVSFLVLCIAILVGFIFKERHLAKRFVLTLLCTEYYFLVLCSTVICRTIEVKERVVLMPFYKYADIWNKVDYPRDLMETLMNIILFLPIGLLLGGIIRKTKWWAALMIGGCLSIIVEFLQYSFSKGQCEVSDVIHNTLGCLNGYGIYKGLSVGFAKVRR